MSYNVIQYECPTTWWQTLGIKKRRGGGGGGGEYCSLCTAINGKMQTGSDTLPTGKGIASFLEIIVKKGFFFFNVCCLHISILFVY